MKSLYYILLFLISFPSYSTDLKIMHDEVISKIKYKNNIRNSDLILLSDSFYKWDRKTNSTTKPKIRKHLGISPDKYGFSLDKETMRGCSNNPSETVVRYLYNDDVIYFYNASCLDWCGETCGKQHSALLRKNEAGVFYTLWSYKREKDQKLIEFNSFNGYMSDFDKDGNIEVLLTTAQGVASEGRVYEITGNSLVDITHYTSNHEGM